MTNNTDKSQADIARDFLNEMKGKWTLISKQTGLKRDWLMSVAQGRINDPGVRRIEILLEFKRTYEAEQAA